MLKETLDDLHRTGLIRFQQPKRWGGMELDVVSLFDIPAEVARGCASTGWNVANLGVHHTLLALYDERAQEEVWGANPDALIASGIAFPQGRGRRVDGGFVISGHWNFSSGVDPSEWNMLAAIIRDGDRVVDHRMCLVPRAEYEIVDDWQVLGMRSTGSKSVSATDVFVPEHRALCMYQARGDGSYPGARTNPNPIYRVPLSALGSHCLAGAGVGNAQAALELTIEAIEARSTSYTAMRMRDFQAVQLRVRRRAPRSIWRGCPSARIASRPSGSRARGGCPPSRRSSASSGTWPSRWGSAPRRWTSSTASPAPTASTTATRSSASSAISTRSPPTSDSAGTPRQGLGARRPRRRVHEPDPLRGVHRWT